MIYLSIRVSPQSGLDTSLRTLRSVLDDADIMHFTKIEDLEKVQSLISNRLASPIDVNNGSAVPLLSVSFHPKLPRCSQRWEHLTQ